MHPECDISDLFLLDLRRHVMGGDNDPLFPTIQETEEPRNMGCEPDGGASCRNRTTITDLRCRIDGAITTGGQPW